MIIPFGPWEPDRSRLVASDGTTNALPHADGWGPMPGGDVYSAALPGVCRGAFLARNSDGTFTVFAATATAIYRTTGTTWTDVTRTVGGAYNLASGDSWSMTQFGQTVLFVNVNDAPQAYTLGSSTAFANLAGSPPQCRYVGVSGDYVLLLSTAAAPNRLHRSGVNDATWWTYKKRGSDYQDLPDGGWITGMVGFERGAVIFSKTCVRQFDDLPGSALLFTLTKTEPALGVVAPDSIVQVGSRIFFRAEDGFYRYVPGDSQNLSVKRCEKWFLNEIDLDDIDQVQGAADPVRQIVWWAFSTDETLSYFNRLIGYNWALDRWFWASGATIEIEWLLSVASPGYTLEELDTVLGYTSIETIPYSLDSRIWKGGRPTLGAFDNAHKLIFFEGANRLATLETPEVALGGDGRRVALTGFRPIGDFSPSTIPVGGQVGVAESFSDTPTYTAKQHQNSTGMIPTRTSSRTARFRISTWYEQGITSTTSLWSSASGIEIPPECIRQAGRR